MVGQAALNRSIGVRLPVPASGNVPLRYLAKPPSGLTYLPIGAAARRLRGFKRLRVVDPRRRWTSPDVNILSAPPRCLDGGNVDFLHRHHRFEGTPCLIATSRERVG